MMQENNSAHWIMGGALMLIGLLVIIALIMTRSQLVNTNEGIVNAAPTVSDLHFVNTPGSGSSSYDDTGLTVITPNAGETRSLDVYATVSDANGTGDIPIDQIFVAAYRDTAGTGMGMCDDPSKIDGNTCSQLIGQCSIDSTVSSTTLKVKCGNLLIHPWADPTTPGADDYSADTWTIAMVAKDMANVSSDPAASWIHPELAEVTAVTFPGALNFGESSSGSARALGFASGVGNNIDFNFMNIGNTDADVQVFATIGNGGENQNTADGSMHCSVGTIPAANIKFNVGSDVAWASMSTALTTSAQDMDLEDVAGSNNALQRRTSESVAPQIDAHFGISIPVVGVSGMCSGNVVMSAVKQSVTGGGQ